MEFTPWSPHYGVHTMKSIFIPLDDHRLARDRRLET